MMRIQKILSHAGIASRREAENIIIQRRVTVDGKVIKKLGVKADIETQDIRLDGIKIKAQPKKYIILNKPRGYLCTRKDSRGRPTIYHFLKGYPQQLFSVGRLDYDAEGLILLTNDGDLAYKLTHPKKGVEKIYIVKVKGIPDHRDLEKMKGGVPLRDGFTLPTKVNMIKRTERNSWIRLSIHEGRYRQIKRMCLFIGHPVIRIKRIGFASLRLGSLKPGCLRSLTVEEIKKLRGCVNAKELPS